MSGDDTDGLRIVQVNLQLDRGGDGRVVSELHKRYRALGYDASLIVGRGTTTGENEWLLPNEEFRSLWAKTILRVADAIGDDRRQLQRIARWAAEPRRYLRRRMGFEDFDYPATLPVLMEMVRGGRTIVHFHNLHGGYFDLRVLPDVCRKAPLVLTLHDQWAFTGHCAQSIDCERWRVGCGRCPDLTIYPGIPRDRTADNFVLKRDVFSRTRIHLTTPSQWLMDRARASLLASAIEDARVIPNGIDTSVFRPASPHEARARLGLRTDATVVLCPGWAARSDFKVDHEAFRSVLRSLASSEPEATVLFLGSPDEGTGTIEGVPIVHRSYERDTKLVADHYRAATVYLHPARAETFGMSVLEAQACGVPVVATDVGGIPELISSLMPTTANRGRAGPPTGVLVDPTAAGMSHALSLVLSDAPLRARLGANAAQQTASEFSITRQVERNLAWYREILRGQRPSAEAVAGGKQARR